jgi:hypothetical protein
MAVGLEELEVVVFILLKRRPGRRIKYDVTWTYWDCGCSKGERQHQADGHVS